MQNIIRVLKRPQRRDRDNEGSRLDKRPHRRDRDGLGKGADYERNLKDMDSESIGVICTATKYVFLLYTKNKLILVSLTQCCAGFRR